MEKETWNKSGEEEVRNLMRGERQKGIEGDEEEGVCEKKGERKERRERKEELSDKEKRRSKGMIHNEMWRGIRVMGEKREKEMRQEEKRAEG